MGRNAEVLLWRVLYQWELTILKSYLSPKEYAKWFGFLITLPRVLIANFLFSSFFFLPLLFVFVLGLMFSVQRMKMFTLPEVTILLSILIVFIVNNAAPPYEGWQMRGDWIARLYQPIFVVLVVPIVRVSQHLCNLPDVVIRKWLVFCGIIVTIIGNGLVVFGPILNDPWRLSAAIYWRFYQHSPVDSMQINLAKYGRRPLGFCQ